MKLLIDIPWVYYNYTKKYHDLSHIETKVFIEALIKGTPIEEDEDCISHSDAIKFFDDCISRQSVLDINENHHGQMPNHINHQIWQEIKDLPSVTPAEKVGYWTKDVNDARELFDTVRYYCSACGDWQGHGPCKYCPNCGAKMEES